VRASPLLASLALLALGACRGGGGSELSYGQVQSVHPGLTADQVVDAFGPPFRADRGPDGRVRTMEYAATDGRGSRARLYVDFDGAERVSGKRFTGAVTKPQ
jgi:hypothetical protein